MQFGEIVQSISTVGFPIVCCIILFIQNDKLRGTIEENTKAIISLSEYIKLSNKEK